LIHKQGVRTRPAGGRLQLMALLRPRAVHREVPMNFLRHGACLALLASVALAAASCDLKHDEPGDKRKPSPSSGKTVLCHYPPDGALEDAETIQVPDSEVESHLAHGDASGRCPKGARCKAGGKPCDFSAQCCSNSCPSGVCEAGEQCEPEGGQCASDEDCCNDDCRRGMCNQILACKRTNRRCKSHAECCTDFCWKGRCKD
jgi:hypothetical protein